MSRQALKKTANWVVFSLVVLLCAGFTLLVVTGKYKVLIVRSESMKPAIQMGDLIVLKSYRKGEELEIGQVISFDVSGTSITHRLVGIEGLRLVTKGDAVKNPDTWPISADHVKGTYLFRVPYLGYAASFLKGRGGAVLLMGLAAVLLGLVVFQFVRSSRRGRPAQAGGRGGTETNEV
jgi:signal peptidase